LGIGTSHSPQLGTPWSHWPNMRRADEASPAIPDNIEALLQPAVHEARFALVQTAVETLSRVLHEPRRAHIPWSGPADQRHQISALMERTRPAYPGAPAFAEHIVTSLTEQDFDVARCGRLNERGLGRAFAFLYQRLWPARRSYALGQAVREAVASWGGGKRVAVIASGGLSHIVVDEPLDRQVLDGLRDHDCEKLIAILREKLRCGTSEILNWIALGGAVDDMEMPLLNYVAGYRSQPSTGCGMAFAQWTR
jgi:hypothetical protein